MLSNSTIIDLIKLSQQAIEHIQNGNFCLGNFENSQVVKRSGELLN